jgi:hypothetical protein
MKKELIHDIKMLRNRLSILETCIERSDAEVLENAFINYSFNYAVLLITQLNEKLINFDILNEKK